MSDGFHIEDELTEKAYDSRLAARLVHYLGPFRRLLIVSSLLLLGATLLSSFLPYFSMKAIDWYISPVGAAASSPEDRGNALTRLVFIMGGLALLEAIARYGQMVLVAYVGQKTMLAMRMEIFEHLQRMSLRFLDRNPVGRLLTRVTGDVENIQQTIVTGLVQAIGEIFSIVCVVIIMFWLNWRLTLAVLVVLPCVIVVSMVFRKYARASYLEIRRRIAKLNAYMQEQVSGMRIVQLFNHEDASYAEYERLNAEHRDEWFRTVRYYALYFPAVDFLGAFGIALVLGYGGYEILQEQSLGASSATLGMIYAYMQWAERMFGPIRSLADKYNLLQAAMASSERIFQLLDSAPDLTSKPGAIVPPKFNGHIEFDHVWFAYEEEDWVLKDVSFTVAPGESVAVVGHTGAGKTTLAALLSRFYDVQRGAIRIDGVDIREYDLTALRKQIGVVLQDVFLFSGSIEHNIRLGDPDMTMDDVEACARHVNAASFIERQPGRYQYDVGERGGNLSTGQRQLLAFARTLAHRPQILVLDEATSSVDTETEGLIQDAIATLMKGRTSLVIAHRLSTVQHASRIVVMHHGEVREIGTHQELLAERGLYYTLYRLQYRDDTAA